MTESGPWRGSETHRGKAEMVFVVHKRGNTISNEAELFFPFPRHQSELHRERKGSDSGSASEREKIAIRSCVQQRSTAISERAMLFHIIRRGINANHRPK